MLFVLGIQTVCSHQAYPDFPGSGILTGFRQIVYISTSRIALVHDIQAELLFLDRIGTERIDIFHHQVPVHHGRRHVYTFQQLDIKTVVGVSRIAVGKFTDSSRTFTGNIIVFIFKSDSQHFICLQTCIQ